MELQIVWLTIVVIAGFIVACGYLKRIADALEKE